MKISIGTGICGIITTFFVYIGCLAGFVLFLIYGIFSVVPGSSIPQNLALGITLIVLAVVGVGSLAGMIAGALVGGIIGAPIGACVGDF